jgi:integrase
MWESDEILTLTEAAALAWPGGPTTARRLRRAIAEGLPALRVAGRIHLVLGEVAGHLADPPRPAPRGGRCGRGSLRPRGAEGDAGRATAGVGGDTPDERPRRTRSGGAEQKQRRARAWKLEGAPPNRRNDTMTKHTGTAPGDTPSGDAPSDQAPSNQASSDQAPSSSLVDLIMTKKFVEAVLAVALAEGRGDLAMPEVKAKRRADTGGYDLWVGRRNEGAIGTKCAATAERRAAMERIKLAAERLGIAEPRLARVEDVLLCLGARETELRPKSVEIMRRAAGRIRPYVAGLRVHELTSRWRQATWDAMRRRWSHATVHMSFHFLSHAIYLFCDESNAPRHRPFKMPPKPPGQERVLTQEELARNIRYCDGLEFYDAATRTWSLRGRGGRAAGRANRHVRRTVGRMLRLGLVTGSRGGRVGVVAWGPNRKHPYIDLKRRRFCRLAVGETAPANKGAPAVELSDTMMERVHEWRREDGPGARYLIARSDGRPYDQEAGAIFRRVLRAVGIADARFHTIRHSVVTEMILAGVSARVIAAIVGMSMQTLEERYDHSADGDVQHFGHAQTDRFLAGEFTREIDVDEEV